MEEEEVEKIILRIRRKFDEGIPFEKQVKYLKQLAQLPITLAVLKKTSIGKTVSILRKEDGKVGEKAKVLISKWKDIASNDNLHVESSNVNSSNKKFHASPDNVMKKSSKSPIEDVSLAEYDRLNGNSSKEEEPKQKMSFQDMLMMPFTEVKKKKKKRKDYDLLKTSEKMIMPTLPDIPLPAITLEPVYRPTRPMVKVETPQAPKLKRDSQTVVSDIVSRKTRTSIFSGKKVSNGVVVSLYQQCMKVLIENVESLYETGGVPFSVLEPLLSKCPPHQLERLEYYNPHFVEDSDSLWKLHCQREFKGQRMNENNEESWRDVYKEKCTGRERRLKKLSSKITEAQASKLPERSVKLAYVSSAPKPSAQMLRKQKRYGTGNDNIAERKKELRARMEEQQRSAAESVVPFTKVPRRDRCAVRPPSSLSSSSRFHEGPPAKRKRDEIGSKVPSVLTPQPVKKSGKKPMMAAALKLMKKQKGRLGASIIRR